MRMTKEQYRRMLELEIRVHSVYGLVNPKRLVNIQEYEEYMKLRRIYADCKGVINE